MNHKIHKLQKELDEAVENVAKIKDKIALQNIADNYVEVHERPVRRHINTYSTWVDFIQSFMYHAVVVIERGFGDDTERFADSSGNVIAEYDHNNNKGYVDERRRQAWHWACLTHTCWKLQFPNDKRKPKVAK